MGDQKQLILRQPPLVKYPPASFERTVTLRPNYAIARYNLAEAYESTNPKQALSEYETYLALVEGIPDEAGRIALVQQRVNALQH
jgi:hypothetical protein